MLYALVKPVVFGLLRLVFGFRTTGTERVPAQGAVILAANHVSFLDPPVVGAGAPRPLDFMAKAELFRIPLLGPLIRALNAHPVEREGADAGALRHALLLLRQGRALLVFPEGTRGTPGTLGRGRPGAGMLAAHSEAPVVPVYVRGTGEVLPRGATRPRRGRITVVYGAPLRFTRSRGKQRYQEISDQIMAAIGRLKAEVERAPAPVTSVVTKHAENAARGPRPAGQIHSTGGTQEWNT
ncbi:MAG TPA: lysophospholipid acyltransferase family protein [Methylomirabilota bacterium]|nr:lysophospholipid acyltransferase family protein [Methylomirabilota bacterium]